MLYTFHRPKYFEHYQQYNHLIIDCGLDPSEAKEELEQFWTEERIQKLFPDVPEEQREVIKNQITTSIADGTYNPVIAAQQKYMANKYSG